MYLLATVVRKRLGGSSVGVLLSPLRTRRLAGPHQTKTAEVNRLGPNQGPRGLSRQPHVPQRDTHCDDLLGERLLLQCRLRRRLVVEAISDPALG